MQRQEAKRQPASTVRGIIPSGPWALALLVAIGACGDPVGVHPDAVALELLPEDTTVLVGEDVAFSLRILDENGQELEPLADGVSPVWDVSNPEPLTLEEPGRVRAAAGGSSAVTVSYGGLTAEAQVRVNPAALDVTIAGAYLVQSVQRLDGTLPLVAQRDAVLRVFPVADQANHYALPLTATINLPDGTTHEIAMPGVRRGVPTSVDQSRTTYQARIPGELVTPEISLTIAVDPDSTVPLKPTTAPTWPPDDPRELDVRWVPPFRLTIVPVQLTAHGTVARMDPAKAREFLQRAVDLYPLNQAEVKVRAVHRSNARLDTQAGWSQLVREIYELRLADKSPRYYYGVVQLPDGSAGGGLAYGGGNRAAVGPDHDPGVMVHELGHTLFLGHAPCGTLGYDDAFPHSDGSIGAWGLNTRTGELFDPDDTKDIMGYCAPRWISDYHYEKAIQFREQNDWDLAGPPG